MVGGVQILPSGACRAVSKSVHFGHRVGGSPLSPPAEIWTPRRPQTIILVLGHPPNTIPGLGTTPGTPGALERAGELKKLKRVIFEQNPWSGADLERFGRIWRDVEDFHQILTDFGWKIIPERPRPLRNTLKHCCGTCTGPWEAWEGPGSVKTRFLRRFKRFPKFRKIFQMRIPNKAVHYCNSNSRRFESNHFYHLTRTPV